MGSRLRSAGPTFHKPCHFQLFSRVFVLCLAPVRFPKLWLGPQLSAVVRFCVGAGLRNLSTRFCVLCKCRTAPANMAHTGALSIKVKKIKTLSKLLDNVFLLCYNIIVKERCFMKIVVKPTRKETQEERLERVRNDKGSQSNVYRNRKKYTRKQKHKEAWQ